MNVLLAQKKLFEAKQFGPFDAMPIAKLFFSVTRQFCTLNQSSLSFFARREFLRGRPVERRSEADLPSPSLRALQALRMRGPVEHSRGEAADLFSFVVLELSV